MQKVPRQMYQVGRSNLILITKWLPCQKALILHKMCEELKKKKNQLSSSGNKLHSSELFFMLKVSHLNHILYGLPRATCFGDVQGGQPQITFKPSLLLS